MPFEQKSHPQSNYDFQTRNLDAKNLEPERSLKGLVGIKFLQTLPKGRGPSKMKTGAVPILGNA